MEPLGKEIEMVCAEKIERDTMKDEKDEGKDEGLNKNDERILILRCVNAGWC